MVIRNRVCSYFQMSFAVNGCKVSNAYLSLFQISLVTSLHKTLNGCKWPANTPNDTRMISLVLQRVYSFIFSWVSNWANDLNSNW